MHQVNESPGRGASRSVVARNSLVGKSYQEPLGPKVPRRRHDKLLPAGHRPRYLAWGATRPALVRMVVISMPKRNPPMWAKKATPPR